MMAFKTKLKQRLYIAISYIVLGTILTAAYLFFGWENDYFFSFGLILLLMGVLRLFRYRKITADDNSIRKQEVTESDERNRMLSERARSWAFSVSILFSGILVIVLNLLGYREQALPFAWYVCGMITIYWVIRLIISKKY